MSVGPAALGTVLVQRLDAVLGTSMGSQANIASGARSDAVIPPGSSDRSGQTNTATDPRQAIQQAGAKAGQNAIVDAKTAAALALAARGLLTSNDATPSAPTTLGQTARTILALFAQFPESAPPLIGKAPLWNPQGGPDGQAPTNGLPSSQTPVTQVQQGQQGQQGQTAAQQNLPTPATPTTATGQAAGTAGATVAGNNPAPTAAQTGMSAATALSLAASNSTPQVQNLAQALRQALQTSGLFYESHLSNLAFGKATAAQLRSEPQAALDQNQAAANTARAQAQTAAAILRNAPGAQGAEINSNTGGPAASSSTTTTLAGIHQDATVLVRQQLDVLANQTITWQGQAWHGAPLEWEIRREHRDPQGNDKDNEEDQATETWATRLKLDLPHLGLIEARLNLAGNQIVMHLAAPRSAAQINAASDILRERLQIAGLTLSNLNVTVVPPRQNFPIEVT